MAKRNITVKLDSAIYKEVAQTFKERGTDISTFIELQLRAFCNAKAKSLLCLKDRMPYGQYAGAQVEAIVRGAPTYILFLIGTHNAKFGGDVYALLKELGMEVPNGNT